MVVEPPITPSAVTETPDRRRRRAWLLVGLALVLFASGLVAGSGLTATLLNARFERMASNPGLVAMAAMSRRLELTPEQHQQVAAILERHRPQFEASAKETSDTLRTMVGEIEEVLTPAQRANFSRMLSYLKHRGMYPPKRRPGTQPGPDRPGRDHRSGPPGSPDPELQPGPGPQGSPGPPRGPDSPAGPPPPATL